MADDDPKGDKQSPGGKLVQLQGDKDKKEPQLRAEVARFAAYFAKPVAVQLRAPYVAIEATYEGNQALAVEGFGWPQVSQVRNPQDGGPMAEPVVVLIGSLVASSDGQMLVFKRRATHTGSLCEILLDPGAIYTLTLITQPAPPPEQQRIVRPGD